MGVTWNPVKVNVVSSHGRSGLTNSCYISRLPRLPSNSSTASPRCSSLHGKSRDVHPSFVNVGPASQTLAQHYLYFGGSLFVGTGYLLDSNWGQLKYWPRRAASGKISERK